MSNLTTKNGLLWVQPDGPGTTCYPLACHDLGDLGDVEGAIDVMRCRWYPTVFRQRVTFLPGIL